MSSMTLLVAATLALPLADQAPDPQNPEGENLATPPDWVVRLDKSNDDATIGSTEESDIYFVNMTPGWHITTGPRAIFYHPASRTDGSFRASTKLHLFDPGDRLEAFGLFIGGTDLEGDAMSYDYFLIRNDGKFLIKRRSGTETSVLQDWTPHDAIARYTATSDGAVTNTLAVVARPETVDFVINDQTAASLPRNEVQTDGVAGLRVNHHLNLHVSDLSIE